MFSLKYIFLVFCIFSSLALADISLNEIREKSNRDRGAAASLIDDEFIKQMKQPLDNPVDTGVPDINTSSKAYKDASQSLGIQTTATPFDIQGESCSSTSGSNNSTCNKVIDSANYIFISSSLSRVTLKKAFSEAEKFDAELVVRGVPPGGSFTDFRSFWYEISKEAGYSAPVIMNPKLYTDYGVNHVPVILVKSPQGISRASGILNFEWLLERTSESGYSDHSFNPIVKDIAEVDFLKDIQQRIENYDFTKHTKELASKAFDKVKKFDFPVRDETYISFRDPTLIVKKDMWLPNGALLAKAGTRLNPLETLGLSKRYIVLNPNDPRQIEVTIKYLSSLPQAQRKPLSVLLTEVNKEKGLNQLNTIRNTFDSTVFVFTDLVQNRFQISSVPAIVEQQGNKLKVTELSI